MKSNEIGQSSMQNQPISLYQGFNPLAICSPAFFILLYGIYIEIKVKRASRCIAGRQHTLGTIDLPVGRQHLQIFFFYPYSKFRRSPDGSST